MGIGDILTVRSGKKFNCIKLEEEGATFVKCKPILTRGEISQELSAREIRFRLVSEPMTGKKMLDLIDDGGTDTKTIKELNDYLKYFVE